MKRFLPILIACVMTIIALFSAVQPVSAQGSTPVPTPDIGYSDDAEVNFVGKAAARSIYFLNWTLQNYQWQCYRPPATSSTPAPEDPQKPCVNEQSPLIGFWRTIRNIVYAFFALFVLITAFVLMTTRGRSLTFQRFLPRFVAVVLLVTFSYALLQFIYITADIIQGFFLTKDTNTLISAEDLLYVGWDYETFRGLRKVHPFFDESVFVNLLLARLTAVTYYAITGVLLIRKIILWFFIVLSPLFPVMLLYYPVRNTAKIWMGEFFRWLFYAPLFSIFLAGLVSLWKTGIPLLFRFEDALNGKVIYPTATNILLGGPGQVVTSSNNLNLPDTFAQYIVALIMLWVVLLLPFVLLQIFLDYLHSFSINESPAFQKLLTSSYSFLNKPQPPPIPLNPSGPSGSTGLARSLPIAKYSAAKQIPNIQDTGDAKEIPLPQPVDIPMSAQINTDILSSSSISLPTMRDIVTYESAMLSQSATKNVSNTYQSLQKIANPQSITNPIERDKFTQIRERLVKESQQGNAVANSVLSAVNIVNNISTVTKNKSVQNTQNLKNALTQIANPSAVVTNSVEKDRMTQLHDSLVKESQQGNTLASTILSTTKDTSVTQVQDLKDKLIRESQQNNQVATNVLATALNSVETTTLQQVIKEVANPQSITNTTERDVMTKIHDNLVKESQQGNDVATTILSSKEITTTDMQQVKEKLLDASIKGDQVATAILSTAITKSDTQTTQQFMQQLAKPETVTNTIEREQYTQLKEKLTQAQTQGNQLATEVLSTINTINQSDATKPETAQQVQNIKQKLLDAKEKGEPLATDMLQLMNKDVTVQTATPVNALLPQSNRVQAVSFEDYEAVKKMWQENYKNLEMPQGITSRKEWIANEVEDVDAIIGLLSSEDQQKVDQGMQEVSNILPFLMLGGFSKDEIVAYLKAKKEAGKSVLEVIEQDENSEDTLVSVEKRHTTAGSATMAQSQEITYTESTSATDDVDASSPLQQVTVQPIQINTALLNLTNLPVPTIKDVVKFEMTLLTKDATNKDEVIRVKETLQQLANPSNISSTADRQRVEQVREQLLQNSQQGDVLATTILQAAQHVTQSSAQPSEVILKETLQKIANPTAVTSEQDRERYVQVHDQIAAAAQQGNQLASMLLSESQTINGQSLHQQLTQAKAQGDPIATVVLDSLTNETKKQQATELPQTNRIQQVSLEDYESVRQMWQENYKSVELPAGMQDRKEWIANDVQSIDQIITLLSSADEKQVQEGMQQVSTILPFLLLGGFSKDEIVAYLKAKKEAGRSVLQTIEQEQNNDDILVNVQATTTSAPAEMTQAVAEEIQASSVPTESSSFSRPVTPVEQTQVSTQLLELTHLPLPTIRDIVRIEKDFRSSDEAKKQEMTQLNNMLKVILHPENAETDEERIKAAQLTQTIQQEVEKGNPIATGILNAAHVSLSITPGDKQEQEQHLLHQFLQQIAHPEENVFSSIAHEKITALHDQVTQESQKNNQIAIAILAVTGESKADQIQQIYTQLLSGKEKGDLLAQSILETFATLLPQDAKPVLPEVNTIQTVAVDDYEVVRQLWEDHYEKEELPGTENERSLWLKKEIEDTQYTLSLLTSSETQKIEEGMQTVSHILPFLLLGGFTLQEIITYLKAKLQAAISVSQRLTQQEEQTEMIPSTDTPSPAQASAQSVPGSVEEPRTDVPSTTGQQTS